MTKSPKRAVVLGAVLVVACGRAPEIDMREQPAADAAPHWTYDGAAGPAAWAALSEEYAACSAGQQQSPIDISSAAAVTGPLQPITFRYDPAHVSLGNTGHTFLANYTAGSYIELDARRYDLQQLHFHHPSEHMIDGRASDLELHLVHRDSAGALAVVGVLIDTASSANASLAAALSRLPAAPGVASEIDIDAAALLPATRDYVTYEGSLTTPPCNEGVRWIIMTERVSAPTAAIAAFANVFPHNARPVQPLHGRVVRASSRTQ